MNTTAVSRLFAGINDEARVSGLSHEFYKYPARFSPGFVNAVIAAFTKPGEIVCDPFVGGGTSAVASLVAGRHALGMDINELAVFLTRVKTTTYTDSQLLAVKRWLDALDGLRIDHQLGITASVRGINDRKGWRLRKLLSLALVSLSRLNQAEQNLARCILLRTGQWALDCRKITPSVSDFRRRLSIHGGEILGGARSFRNAMDVNLERFGTLSRSLCLLRSTVGVEADKRPRDFGSPSLIVTSPPYPGVHVLYHRWQVRGRKETGAPYWIANLADGHGASYYTFADRGRAEMTKYLETAKAAFWSVRRIVRPGTPLVQMVAFSNPDRQLGPYLEMLRTSGWSETNPGDGISRIWRTVPNRKWYTSIVETRTNRELVLFHVAA